jgi:N-methylhydantoinase A
MPGALSAVGILLADAVRDYSRTVMLPGNAIESLEESFAQMERRGIAEFRAEGLEDSAQGTRTIDMRYRSQGYELNVPYDDRYPKRAVEAFHRLHRQRYGFCDELRPLEIVNLRLRMTAASEPWSPATQDPVPGNGSAACYATRDIFFNGKFVASRLYRRDGLIPGDSIDGPALITEYTAATVLPPGCSARVDNIGNLVISIGEENTK